MLKEFATVQVHMENEAFNWSTGVAILYAYMFLGLGFLRCVTPEFGDLASHEQQLEGTFR